jgi:hypothetical protein
MWLHHGWASNPLRLHPTSLSYVCKCFSTLISCEWVYGTTLSLILPLSLGAIVSFGVGTDLSDMVTSWLSLKPHLDGFTNPYHIYIQCFCTLISCEWVYDTTLSPIPPLSLGYILRNFGVGTDLSDVGTSWLSLKPHLECFTNPCHVYIKCFCTLSRCEWVYGTTLSPIPPLTTESRVNFREFWGGDRPVWCGYIMVEPQTPLGVLHKSMSYLYKVFLHLDKL